MAAPVNVRSKNAYDPFLSYKFLVSWDGKPVAYVNQVSALTRTTQVVSWREGGAPQGVRRIPGQTEYGPITLERGVTFDINFEQWANKVWYYPNTGKLGNEVSLGDRPPGDFRKDIKIELMNEAGQILLVYYVFNCWPSEYIALPELDASANAVAIQTLTLQNEGWTRDDSVKAPKGPTFADPSSPLIQTFDPPSGG